MKREILNHKFGKVVSGCCPGHDTWPNDVYRGKRSIRARSRDKKREHRYARTLAKRQINAIEE